MSTNTSADTGSDTITTLGIITQGTWNANIVGLAYGGTNANLTASAGAIPYSTATSLALLPPTTSNKVFMSGTGTVPAWSSATYPVSTTINQILYSSGPNTISGITTANNGVLVTSGGGTPSISAVLPSAVQLGITSLGTITAGSWNASTIPMQYGGTNTALTANPSGLVYSTLTGLAILAPTVVDRIPMSSGGTIAPAWSSTTYPRSTTINQLLYSPSANVISGLPSANNATLVTNASGIPSFQTISSNFVTSLTGTANQITVSPSSTGDLTLSLPSSVIITNSVQAGNLRLNGNTLQTMNTNGNILIVPNGTGITSFTNNVGFGVINPNSAIQTSNTVTNRVITLYEANNNAHEFYGFGINAGVLRYQAFAGASHVWYISTSSTASTEVMRGNLLAGGTGALGVGGITPSYTGDFNGTVRSKRLLGNGNIPSIAVGPAAGTGATATIVGCEESGVITINTGISLSAGIFFTLTLSSAMPNANWSLVLFPSSQFGASTQRNENLWATYTTTTVTLNTDAAISLSSVANKWSYIIIGST